MNNTCGQCQLWHKGYCPLLEMKTEAGDKACAHFDPKPQPTHYRTSTGAAVEVEP